MLDHGFVRVIDYMGDDAAIVQAARVSYGRGTRRVSEDAGLIRYLMRHRHSTPFEMCEIKYHVKLPIFVARQWIRHRTANVNEYSARYSILDREFYLPAPEHLAAQSAVNRQGRGDVLAGDEAAQVLDLLREDATRSYDHYAEMLNEDEQGAPRDPARQGLARELARMNLTLNTYTQWYWKIDLHNLLHFLSLRADRARAVRDPRLCRGDAGDGEGLGAGRLPGVPRLPAGRGDAVGADAGGGAADAGGRGGDAGGQRAEPAGVGGADGGAWAEYQLIRPYVIRVVCIVIVRASRRCLGIRRGDLDELATWLSPRRRNGTDDVFWCVARERRISGSMCWLTLSCIARKPCCSRPAYPRRRKQLAWAGGATRDDTVG